MIVVLMMVVVVVVVIMKRLLGNFRFLFSQNLHFKSKKRETRLLKITIVGI